MRYIRLRLRSNYPAFLDNRRRMVLFLVLSALFLFALNYLLLVSVKLLLDIPHPFQLVYKGTRLLLITWLTELVIVSQSVSNRFYRDLLAACLPPYATAGGKRLAGPLHGTAKSAQSAFSVQ